MQQGQLRWQCRRGMLELELLLLKFLGDRYYSLSSNEKQCFIQLLQESDPTLQQWLLGQALPPTLEMQALVRSIHGLL